MPSKYDPLNQSHHDSADNSHPVSLNDPTKYDPLSQPPQTCSSSDIKCPLTPRKFICGYYCFNVPGKNGKFFVLGKDIFSLSDHFPIHLLPKYHHLQEVIFELEPLILVFNGCHVLIPISPFTFGRKYIFHNDSTYRSLGVNERKDLVLLYEAFHFFYGKIVFHDSQQDLLSDEMVSSRTLGVRQTKSLEDYILLRNEAVEKLSSCSPKSLRYVITGALLTGCFEMIELIVEEISLEKIESAIKMDDNFLFDVRRGFEQVPKMIKLLAAKAFQSIPSSGESCHRTTYQIIFSALWCPSMLPMIIINSVEEENCCEILDYFYSISQKPLKQMPGITRKISDCQTRILSNAITTWLLKLANKGQTENVVRINHWIRNYLVVAHYHSETITSHISSGTFYLLQDSICRSLY
jgi:hypothetical protein